MVKLLIKISCALLMNSRVLDHIFDRVISIKHHYSNDVREEETCDVLGIFRIFLKKMLKH